MKRNFDPKYAKKRAQRHFDKMRHVRSVYSKKGQKVPLFEYDDQ